MGRVMSCPAQIPLFLTHYDSTQVGGMGKGLRRGLYLRVSLSPCPSFRCFAGFSIHYPKGTQVIYPKELPYHIGRSTMSRYAIITKQFDFTLTSGQVVE